MSVGIITQARVGSSRLPGKVFLSIGSKTLLGHHLSRLNDSGISVIVATTTRPRDDIIERFCHKNRMLLYRGDEDDVLDRYYQCAKEYRLDTVIRVTSDCPLIDGQLIRDSYAVYQKRKNPMLYYSNTVQCTFPRGLDFEIFSFGLLEMAHQQAVEQIDREHVTPYLWKNKSGTVSIEQRVDNMDRSNWRLTVDELDDFLVIYELIENYGADRLGWDGLSSLLDSHPKLIERNQNVQQVKV